MAHPDRARVVRGFGFAFALTLLAGSDPDGVLPRVLPGDPAWSAMRSSAEPVRRGGRPFSGTFVEHYENGALFRETRYRAGRKDGPTKIYHLNGRPKEWGNFRGGQREGFQYGWFFEGPRRFEYHFAGGLLEGAQTDWHMNGNLFRRVVFSKGVETDKKILYADGSIFTNYAVRDARLYGLDGGTLCMETAREGQK